MRPQRFYDAAPGAESAESEGLCDRGVPGQGAHDAPHLQYAGPACRMGCSRHGSGSGRRPQRASGTLSAKPRNVSAAQPLRTHPQAAIPPRQRRAPLPVIVHADDFGETVDITEGICLAIEAGVVTSTSVMLNMPGTAQALRRAPHLGQQASFGVHLNLCEGKPLTLGATLMGPDGQFLRKRPLA